MSTAFKPRRGARWWAALLSFLAPGLGQTFNGEYRRAIGFVIAYALSTLPQNAILIFPDLPTTRFAASFLAAMILGLGVGLVSAVDAYRRRGRTAPSLGRWQRYLVYVVLIAAVELPDLLVADGPNWKAFSIPSGSMIPTLDIGDRIIAMTDYDDDRTPARGDVAVFELPTDRSVDFVKRVIGLPGDTIQVTHGILQIDGAPVERALIGDRLYRETLPNGVSYHVRVDDDDAAMENTAIFTVPEGRYFMMGDNRDDSADSRMDGSGVGFVPAENFVARAGFVYMSFGDKAASWKFWTWPRNVRWDRIGLSLEGRGDAVER